MSRGPIGHYQVQAQRSLNPLPNFYFFINHCHYVTYEGTIFGELGDNRLSGCTPVVGADSLKMGLFWGHLCAAQCALVGW